jgi:hypothetical protein
MRGFFDTIVREVVLVPWAGFFTAAFFRVFFLIVFLGERFADFARVVFFLRVVLVDAERFRVVLDLDVDLSLDFACVFAFAFFFMAIGKPPSDRA